MKENSKILKCLEILKFLNNLWVKEEIKWKSVNILKCMIRGSISSNGGEASIGLTLLQIKIINSGQNISNLWTTTATKTNDY